MLTPRLSYLFTRYWDRAASPEEREELMALLNTGEHDDDFRALVDEAMQRTQIMEMNEESAALILASILSVKEKQAPVVPIFRKRIIKFAVAASITGVITAGSYFLFFNKKQTAPTETTQNTKADIPAPTTNRASITLANGKKIFLDSVGKGTLAEQGSVKIEKLNDGRIAYNGYAQPKTETAYNTLFNPRGSKVITLTLSDGTQVWLNAESSIKYPVAFSGKERIVETTGEAYFEVAHDAGSTFEVKTPNELIRDIGTHFNVNAYADEPLEKTTLTEGKIAVRQGTTIKNLIPGQQFSVEKANGHAQVINDVDIDQALAWKNGKFQFGESADIQEIMRQVSRWYDVEVEFRGNVTGHIGGTISRNVNASQVFQMLEMTGSVKFKIDGKKVIVEP